MNGGMKYMYKACKSKRYDLSVLRIKYRVVPYYVRERSHMTSAAEGEGFQNADKGGGSLSLADVSKAGSVCLWSIPEVTSPATIKFLTESSTPFH